LVQFLLALSVETDLLDQPRLDVVVVQKLGECAEFFAQELVGHVHGRVHDTRAVRADRVGNVADIDGVEMLKENEVTWTFSTCMVIYLVVGVALDKDLVVEVVVVSCDKDVNVAHDFKSVHTLIERFNIKMHKKAVIATCSRVPEGRWTSVISMSYFSRARLRISAYVRQSCRATVVRS